MAKQRAVRALVVSTVGVLPALLTAASRMQVAIAATKNLVAAIDDPEGTEGEPAQPHGKNRNTLYRVLKRISIWLDCGGHTICGRKQAIFAATSCCRL